MNVTEEQDSSDLDALEELDHSRGYFLVCECIRRELERKRRELEQALDQQKTDTARGYIHALLLVLTMPELLKREIATEIAGV